MRVLTSRLHHDYSILPNKLAYHDITKKEKLPTAMRKLLGLGMKFCLATIDPNYRWLEKTQKDSPDKYDFRRFSPTTRKSQHSGVTVTGTHQEQTHTPRRTSRHSSKSSNKKSRDTDTDATAT